MFLFEPVLGVAHWFFGVKLLFVAFLFFKWFVIDPPLLRARDRRRAQRNSRELF